MNRNSLPGGYEIRIGEQTEIVKLRVSEIAGEPIEQGVPLTNHVLGARRTGNGVWLTLESKVDYDPKSVANYKFKVLAANNRVPLGYYFVTAIEGTDQFLFAAFPTQEEE